MVKKGLGRGLGALMDDNEPELFEETKKAEPKDGALMELSLSDIEPNRRQARKTFDEATLAELADSITEHGLLEPIVVRRKENGYFEIIAGERRWRASRMAGLSKVPALVRTIDDEEAALLSLIENLQREDLNPVEEALGYRDLIAQFGLTQEEAASRVGKSRANVANLMRILRLPEEVLALVRNGSLSYGHARTLVPLCDRCDDKDVLVAARKIAEEEWSVRQTEQFVKNYGKAPVSKPAPSPVEKEYFQRLERRVGEAAGRKASIRRERGGAGKLVLSFSSSEDLENLIKELCGNDFFSAEPQE